MQMGPALLPTPLSPARGLPFAFRPRAVRFRKRLAPDVFPRALQPAFCHRRSRRHPVPSLEGPAFPGLDPFLPTLGSIDFPAAVRSLDGRSFQVPLAEASVSRHSRPVSPGRVSELPHPGHRIACVWPKPSASNPRKSRGQPLAHRLFWKFSGFSILSDEKPEVFRPSRWVKTAPADRFWQLSQE